MALDSAFLAMWLPPPGKKLSTPQGVHLQNQTFKTAGSTLQKMLHMGVGDRELPRHQSSVDWCGHSSGPGLSWDGLPLEDVWITGLCSGAVVVGGHRGLCKLPEIQDGTFPSHPTGACCL
jgi:hypothetical protein